jgi:hypothetical protein
MRFEVFISMAYTLKMEAVGSSETSGNTFNITRRINPDDEYQ